MKIDAHHVIADKGNKPCFLGRKAGYSLVEVCLALLVVAVGLLAVFGLFPDGLSASRRAVETTEMSAFSEYVFSSLEIEASDPLVSWGSFANGLQLMRTHALKDADGNQPRVTASGPLQPHTYYWTPDFYAGGSLYVDSEVTVTYFTYTLSIGDADPNVSPAKYARLEVWPGDYNDSMPPTKGTVFYREFLPVK
jgi:hypothetical protein